jgi:hypothetical protein
MKSNTVLELQELAGNIVIKKIYGGYDAKTIDIDHYKELVDDELFEWRISQKINISEKLAEFFSKKYYDFHALHESNKYEYTMPHFSQARDPRTKFFTCDIVNLSDLNIDDLQQNDILKITDEALTRVGANVISMMFQNSKYNKADINSCHKEIAKLIIDANITESAKCELITILKKHKEKTQSEYQLLLKFEKKFIEKLHLYHLKINHLRYSYTFFKGEINHEEEDCFIKSLYIKDDEDGSQFEEKIQDIATCRVLLVFMRVHHKNDPARVQEYAEFRHMEIYYQQEPKCVSGLSIKSSIDTYKTLLAELDRRIENIVKLTKVCSATKSFIRCGGVYVKKDITL